MIKIRGIGRGRSGDAAAPESTAKRQPGEIRIQKELEELELPPNASITFPDKDYLMIFRIRLIPDEGFWKGAAYDFVFSVPGTYPHDPPRVQCETKIYHPNIDVEGKVCLNILREDWKPILSISSVIYGLLYLLLEPNPTDPLNHDAASVLRNNRAEFARMVKKSLVGGFVSGENFPRLV